MIVKEKIEEKLRKTGSGLFLENKVSPISSSKENKWKSISRSLCGIWRLRRIIPSIRS